MDDHEGYRPACELAHTRTARFDLLPHLVVVVTEEQHN